MTAEEFFEKWCDEKGYAAIDQADDIEECLRSFAEMHVQAALKAAEKIGDHYVSPQNFGGAIIEAYPLTNIK